MANEYRVYTNAPLDVVDTSLERLGFREECEAPEGRLSRSYLGRNGQRIYMGMPFTPEIEEYRDHLEKDPHFVSDPSLIVTGMNIRVPNEVRSLAADALLSNQFKTLGLLIAKQHGVHVVKASGERNGGMLLAEKLETI